jgi:hypothetical protein
VPSLCSIVFAFQIHAPLCFFYALLSCCMSLLCWALCVYRGFKYVFIKSTHAYLHKCITWPK